jgi:hypothetical protein
MNAHTFFVGALLVAGAMPLAGLVVSSSADEATSRTAAGHHSSVSLEWPTHFRDRPLTQLPLGELEARFARRFPGAIGRFTDGERVLIVRQVARPTRQLHPAEDCFKALGYATGRAQPVVDAAGAAWRCFPAARDGTRLRVCERIVDAEGRHWTDVSAWFWAAQYGGGPWQATTVVTRDDDTR